MTGSEIAVLVAIIVVILLAVRSRRGGSSGRYRRDTGQMRAAADMEIAKAGGGWPGQGGPTSGPGGGGSFGGVG